MTRKSSGKAFVILYRILVYICPHTVAIYLWRHTYYYICALILLLYMWCAGRAARRTSFYTAYYYICALILLLYMSCSLRASGKAYVILRPGSLIAEPGAKP